MNEIALTALATLCAVGIPAGIAFYFKTYLPWRQAQETDQQEFTQAESEELRRHKQGLEVKKLESGILRSSWREDKLAEELERSTTFIREVVHALLKEHDKRLGNIESLLENYRQLAGILSEIKDDLRGKGKD